MSSTGPFAAGSLTLSDALVAAGRAAGAPWTRVEVVAAIDSTNAAALRDPVAGSLLVADTQSAARGRHGRSWTTPPGQALALSATLTIPAGHPAPGWIPLAAGLAVDDAVRSLVGDVVALKWPNDVLAQGDSRKVCGVLAQVARVPTAVAEGVVVVGVGLNVAVTTPPVPTATSLHLLAQAAGVAAPDRDEVAVAVAGALAARHAAWARGGASLEALRADYRDRSATIGADVHVHLGDDVVAGRAIGVDDDGCLVVDVPGQGRRAFSAGEVEHLRRPARGAS